MPWVVTALLIFLVKLQDTFIFWDGDLSLNFREQSKNKLEVVQWVECLRHTHKELILTLRTHVEKKRLAHWFMFTVSALIAQRQAVPWGLITSMNSIQWILGQWEIPSQTIRWRAPEEIYLEFSSGLHTSAHSLTCIHPPPSTTCIVKNKTES